MKKYQKMFRRISLHLWKYQFQFSRKTVLSTSASPWTAARRASLSTTNSPGLLKLLVEIQIFVKTFSRLLCIFFNLIKDLNYQFFKKHCIYLQLQDLKTIPPIPKSPFYLCLTAANVTVLLIWQTTHLVLRRGDLETKYFSF